MRISDWSSDVCSSDLERGVEGEHQHLVGARRLHQRLALIERGKAEPRAFRAEEAHRMWIEGRDQRGPPLGTGTRHRAAYHRLMARMKSVEIAERDDPAPQMSGHRRAAVQPLHRPRYRGVRPSMPDRKSTRLNSSHQ